MCQRFDVTEYLENFLVLGVKSLNEHSTSTCIQFYSGSQFPISSRTDAILRPCLVPNKFCKIFQIPRHIEYLDACMEY